MRRPLKKKRAPQIDIKHDSEKIAKFVNYIMLDGKKTIAQNIVYDAFDEIKKQLNKDPLGIFELALQNVSPLVEVKSRRVGGATYQVPKEVSPHRRQTLAYRWIIESARKKKSVTMSKALAEELINASKNEGDAVVKRANTHKMAEANRAFAHYAW